LPYLSANDIARNGMFPSMTSWNARNSFPSVSFRWPFLTNLIVSAVAIEAIHTNGSKQTIPVRWARTGYGGHYRPRPLFICTECGNAFVKLHYHVAHLACRYCLGAVYASQTLHKRTRPALQACRLHSFLDWLPPNTRRTTRTRLKNRYLALKAKAKAAQLTKRLDGKASLPQGNYLSRAGVHWA
jgi:hypothetical protein